MSDEERTFPQVVRRRGHEIQKILLLASNVFCGRPRAWVSDRHGDEVNLRSISVILPKFAQFLNNHRPVND